MKETEQTTTEIKMKALQYINIGYQRILTFECRSGGFNWWEGDNPGNPILTALAIMMLTDTSKVYKAVDKRVIKRAFDYLSGLQQGDGSFRQDTHLHAGNENLGVGTLRSTCYITWGMAYGGFGKTGAAKKAVKYITRHAPKEEDLYTMGMCANALALSGAKGKVLDGLIAGIAKAGVRGDETLHWTAKGATLVGSGGIAASVELTSLMALAYMEAGKNTRDVPDIVNWLISTKDPNGNWGYNTQATVLALKAFIMAAREGSKNTNARASVKVNGVTVAKHKFTDFNRDVVWQVEVPDPDLKGDNAIELNVSGEGNLGYQVIASHFTPWAKGRDPRQAPLTIAVEYDSDKVKVSDSIEARVRIKKNTEKPNGMLLVTLGVPPGFDVATGDLVKLQKKKTIRQYELTGRQLILYLDDLPVGKEVELKYGLTARYPVKAQTGESEVRYYYDGAVRAVATPTALEAVE